MMYALYVPIMLIAKRFIKVNKYVFIEPLIGMLYMSRF